MPFPPPKKKPQPGGAPGYDDGTDSFPGGPNGPAGVPGGPPGMGGAPGMGAMPPMMPPPGMPRAGQTMDPMMAMLNGMPQFPPPPPPAPGPPMGPGGLPVGGSMPDLDPNFSPEMGDSQLLKALSQSVGGYDAGPLGHADLAGLGPEDPNMGIEQLMQMIALGNAGVGGAEGGVPPGGSGVNYDRGNPGFAVGY